MTSKNMIVSLPTDSRGNYRCDRGWKTDPDGKRKQHRFYLGRDRHLAQVRALAIEGIWTAIEMKTKGPATWDKLRLAVAMAVSRGDEAFQVDPAEYGLEFGDWMGDGNSEQAPVFFPNEEAKLAWFRELQEECKGIRLVLAGEAESVKTVEDQAQGYKRVADRLKATARPSSEQTLHQALDAFGQWLGRHYLDASGRTSTFGTACQRQAGNIKEHSADVKLSAFGCSAIEDLIAYWKNRPQTKRGKPCSTGPCPKLHKCIRHFVKWLHRSDAWDWKKPFDLELDPVRIQLTPAERAAKLSTTQVESYTVEELGILWKYASPKERLPMLLALNCGFGQAEIGTLQLAEVHLREAHGHYPLVGSFIKRLRGKTGIYGEWKLWPETEAALDWYLSRRPQTEETALTRNQGRPQPSRVNAGGKQERPACQRLERPDGKSTEGPAGLPGPELQQAAEDGRESGQEGIGRRNSRLLP